MKVKASWAAFVPLTVGAVVLHIYHLFFLGGDEITQQLFGGYSLLINKTTEPELIVIFAAVMFGFLALFNLIDRQTSSYCDIKRDAVSGLFLVLSGLLLGVESAVSLVTVSPESETLTSDFAINIIGVTTALIFAIVGMGLMIGFNIAKKMRAVMLVPTLWAAVEMIKSFVSHREQAPSFSFFDVFVWVFLTMFLFHNSMVLCGIEIKNPVKSSFTYGLMFVLFSCIYSISGIKGSYDELGYFDITSIIPILVVASLGVYTLFSLVDLSSKMITKKKADELYGSLSDEQKSEKKSSKKNDDEDEESSEPEAAFGVGSTKYVTAEFEKIRLEKATKKAQERTGKIPSTSNDDDDDDEDEEPMSTLDKIDQLIMELSDDANKM